MDPVDRAAVAAAADRRDALLDRTRRGLAAALKEPASGARGVERDAQVRRLRRRERELTAACASVLFGRLDTDRGDRLHVGRTGLVADDGRSLVVDWRAPAARAFYAATPARPLGVVRRRHLVVRADRLLRHQDELLLDGPDQPDDGTGAPGGHLLDALAAPRTGRMRDIVQTVQAEQDAAIRADRHGVLVVQGAPGTGKTAVALHRVAYLLYEHRDLLERSGVLVLGPSRAFLDHVSGVLPALGESAVVPATIADLHPGVRVSATEDVAVAEVKGRLAMADVVRRAVALLQAVPDTAVPVEVEGTTVLLRPDRVRRARAAARATRLPHEPARPVFADAVVEAVAEEWAAAIGTDPWDGSSWLTEDDLADLRRDAARAEAVAEVVEELWPSLTPTRLVERLWTDPALLAGAADGLLSSAEQALLLRPPGAGWTGSDVPLLEEAAELLGEDDSAERARLAARRAAEEAYARGVLEVLHGSRPLEDDDADDAIDWSDAALALPVGAADLADRFTVDDDRPLAERALADRSWTFGHVVVDEAQELTPMDWRAVARRCPARSMTVVGDLAQTARRGAPGTWEEALGTALTGRWRLVELDVSYRTPAEILEPATALLQRWRPDLRPPRAIRRSGRPVRPVLGVPAPAVPARVAEEAGRLAGSGPGTTAVVAPARLADALVDALARTRAQGPANAPAVEVHTPRGVKGLEFDRVVLVEPGEMAPPDRYVALTRATAELAVVSTATGLPW